MSFENIDREAAQEASRIKREQSIAYAEANLKNDWQDTSYWKDLSSKHGVRLPAWYIANTSTKYIKRLFRMKNMDIREYVESCGCKSLKELVDLHPSYPAWVELCFALEYIEDKLNTSNETP